MWQRHNYYNAVNMSYTIMLFLLCLLNLIHERVSVKGHKLVYKKDYSEYCRRRVTPSLFLGGDVTEASFEIMHFSKLELPYSCLISIRSESGSNIILVIEYSSTKNLKSSCSKEPNQLLVYEMAETFGGYWGTLPHSVVQQDFKNEPKYYTIKTTPSLKGIKSWSAENYDDYNAFTKEEEKEEKLSETIKDDIQSDGINYITEEVSLVNVSGFRIPGVKQRPLVDIDSLFDLAYDVTPE